jgi:bifunctional DNA-binding transcriptional regulator/antitoxin component of YhaV-PrlF toxin-antitoxin module
MVDTDFEHRPVADALDRRRGFRRLKRGGHSSADRPSLVLTNPSKIEVARRITNEGHVTIPQHIRERAGLMPGTDVEFVLVEAAGTAATAAGVEVRLPKTERSGARRTRGRRLVDTLRGRGSSGMSTDEVIAPMRGASADDETAPPHGSTA